MIDELYRFDWHLYGDQPSRETFSTIHQLVKDFYLKDFFEKHKFFEGQFEQLDDIIDNVAERIRTLGHYTSSSLKSFLEITHLSEDVPEKNNSQAHIRALMCDHEIIIIHCRENIHQVAIEYNDFGTSDFITGLMEIHEKMAFFLRSHLK